MTTCSNYIHIGFSYLSFYIWIYSTEVQISDVTFTFYNLVIFVDLPCFYKYLASKTVASIIQELKRFKRGQIRLAAKCYKTSLEPILRLYKKFKTKMCLLGT